MGCETASGADWGNVALMCGCGLLSSDSLQTVRIGAIVRLAHLQFITIIQGPCSSVPLHTQFWPALFARPHAWGFCCLAATPTPSCFAWELCHVALICLTGLQCATYLQNLASAVRPLVGFVPSWDTLWVSRVEQPGASIL